MEQILGVCVPLEMGGGEGGGERAGGGSPHLQADVLGPRGRVCTKGPRALHGVHTVSTGRRKVSRGAIRAGRLPRRRLEQTGHSTSVLGRLVGPHAHHFLLLPLPFALPLPLPFSPPPLYSFHSHG